MNGLRRGYNWALVSYLLMQPESGLVGTGVFKPEFDVVICKRINNRLAVFTAERTAICLGMQWEDEARR